VISYKNKYKIMKKVLVIAPHPDDEVLGCGGTMAKYASRGDDVYLCVATQAYTPDWPENFIKGRKKEVSKANQILKVKKTFFLNFPTAKLDTIPQKDINEAIGRVIKETKSQIIFIPHQGDLHSDHKIIFLSSLVATRPDRHSFIEQVLSYETLSETEWGNPIYPFLPNIYEDISEFLEKKIEAMDAYKSEIKEYPHARSSDRIRCLAGRRGSEANLKFAESFLLIREINL
jgi:LmbE family N-acetylglucosaminyl deacetylase